MNYQQTIQYLYSRLPMFSSHGQNAIKPGLQNIIKFCGLLKDPHLKFKTIHIGGTNGKGSTSHMLAAILQIAGYRTGLYTSPHLRDFRERIRVNGQMISEEAVATFVNENRIHIETIEPSFFETTVALAFDYFAKQNIDVAVVEVGLGGRLDSTNIIHPELSVITNIGLDHVNILGNTLAQIAFEKAGIIKAGVPVVIGQKQDEVKEVFMLAASTLESRIVFASDEWEVTETGKNQQTETTSSLLSVSATPKGSEKQISAPGNYQLDLTGSYQLKNLCTVLSSVEQLRMMGYVITDDHIRKALKQVTKITGLMGRWQTISTNPRVICDTGHNEDGIREVMKNIAVTPYERLHMVIGMVKDKDISKILSLLPKEAIYYFCKPDIPRAKEADDLAKEAKAAGLSGNAFASVKQALEEAKKNAGANDLIFVGGSTFVVAEII